MAAPTLIVEIAFDNGPFDTVTTWYDVSADVLNIERIKRGRSREGGRWEAGVSALTLDSDNGTYTPGNTRSAYSGRLLPMRPIRIRATYSATTYDLFYGFIERWQPAWPGGLISTTRLEVVDGFKLLSVSKVTFSSLSFAAYIRVGRLLNAINWPSAMRDIDSSDFIYVTSVSLVQQPPITHMQDVVAAVDAQIWVRGDGYFVFRNRYARIVDTVSSVAQAQFGADPLPTTAWTLGSSTLSVLGSATIPRPSGFTVSSELPYLSVTPSFDDQFIVNDAEITAAGGVAGAQIATDSASQATYGIRTTAATYIIANGTGDADAIALGRAQWMVLQGKDAKFRVLNITISGKSSDSLWPIMLTLDISYRVSVMVRPGNGAGAIYGEYYIESLEHRSISNDDWQVTYQLSPVPADTFWIVEDPILGVLDSTTRLIF
jgi:hypothetical protein